MERCLLPFTVNIIWTDIISDVIKENVQHFCNIIIYSYGVKNIKSYKKSTIIIIFLPMLVIVDGIVMVDNWVGENLSIPNIKNPMIVNPLVSTTCDREVQR